MSTSFIGAGPPMQDDSYGNRKKRHRHAHLILYFILFYYLIYQSCSASLSKLLLYLLLLIPPRLALFLRRRLPSIFCILSDVLLLSNVAVGTHDHNIAPCGTICRGAMVQMGATVFWVCRKRNSKESWGW